MTLLVELKQIPHIWIVYRRPAERELNPEKIVLDGRQLKHVPLLEGEEKIKFFNLSNNEIQKLENLVSLPYLNYLDLSQNLISQINTFPSSNALQQLRVLLLSKNRIESIQNLDQFVNLDVLDLQDNRIQRIDNVHVLTHLRVLNLAGNLIEKVDIIQPLKNLQELNLRKNQITEITTPFTVNIPNLQKLFLAGNKLTNFFESVGRINCLTDLTMDGNPVENQAGFIGRLKETYARLAFYNLKNLSLSFDAIPLEIPRSIKESAVK